MTHGKTYNRSPRRINHKATKSKTNTGTTALCLSVYHFVLVFFSPFSIAITSLGEEKANLSAFRTFVRFVLVWICRFPLPLGSGKGCGL